MIAVKPEQISSSLFPELSEPCLISEKVAPFPGECQPLGLRKRDPREALQRCIIPKGNKTLRRMGLYYWEDSFSEGRTKRKHKNASQRDGWPRKSWASAPQSELVHGSGMDGSKSVSLSCTHHMQTEPHISLRSWLWGAKEIIDGIPGIQRDNHLQRKSPPCYQKKNKTRTTAVTC